MKSLSKLYLPVRIVHVERLTPLVKRFRLAALGGSLPRYTAGAHIETKLTIGGKTYLRAFSLCGPLGKRDTYEIAIRRQPNPKSATAAWHEHADVGTELAISLPVNQFPLSEQARHHILVAAGIGITPMIPMLEQLAQDGSSFELHYGVRDLEHAAFADALSARYQAHVHMYTSRAGSRMTSDILAGRPVGTHIYLCGPEQMQRMFYDAATLLGYPKGNIHFERFVRSQSADDKPFKVTLAKQGRTIEVAASVSLLDALNRCGVDVPYSCRAGGCGTCCLPVVAGELDHRDFFLSDEEKETHKEVLPCVSRARSPHIVLDL